ncbi:unnamed protein product [Effrenium voratum]|nr:unnamed protein product [Effrenium voratum]
MEAIDLTLVLLGAVLQVVLVVRLVCLVRWQHLEKARKLLANATNRRRELDPEERRIQALVEAGRMRVAKVNVGILLFLSSVTLAGIQVQHLKYLAEPVSREVQWAVLVNVALYLALWLGPELQTSLAFSLWYLVASACTFFILSPAATANSVLTTRSLVTFAFWRLPTSSWPPSWIVACCGFVLWAQACVRFLTWSEPHSSTMHENPLVVETFMFGVSLAVKVGFECLLRSMAVLQVRHDKVGSELQGATSLLRHICDAVIEVDADLRLTKHSKELANMLLRHRPGGSLEGVSFTDFMTPADAQNFSKLLEAQLAGKAEDFESNVFHTRLVDSCSSQFRVETFQVRYERWDGQVCSLIGLRDFTDQGCLAANVINDMREHQPEHRDGLARMVSDSEVSYPWRPSSGSSATPELAATMAYTPEPLPPGPGEKTSQPGDSQLLLEIDLDTFTVRSASVSVSFLAGCALGDLMSLQGQRLFRQVKPQLAALEQNGQLGCTVFNFGFLDLHFGAVSVEVDGVVEIMQTQRGELSLIMLFAPTSAKSYKKLEEMKAKHAKVSDWPVRL